MAERTKSPHNGNVVELIAVDGGWSVRVVEDGEQSVHTFEWEAFARAYAEGQRIRLGLEKAERF